MLIGLDPLLAPDLLHALASMGHGDEIAIVDANFPAAACARRLVALDYEPAFDVDGALATARQITGRDDPWAHLDEATA